MSGKSTYFEVAALNVLRNVSITGLATVYVALFSADPTDAATGGTEVTTTLRAAGRLGIAGATVFAAPSGSPSSMANSSSVDFGTAAAGATVSYIAIFDAATAGNKLYSGALTTPRTFVTGDAVLFPAGSITITES